MKPIAILRRRQSGGGGGGLDTQTVTVDQDGSTGDRRRGFISGVLGGISDGTSNIYGGSAITKMAGDEFAANFQLTISGATNTGWTTMTNTTDGTSLNRADATFSGGTWTWPGSHLTFFSTQSGSKTVVFT